MLNWLRPEHMCICGWTVSLLVQVMACCLFGVKALLGPLMTDQRNCHQNKKNIFKENTLISVYVLSGRWCPHQITYSIAVLGRAYFIYCKVLVGFELASQIMSFFSLGRSVISVWLDPGLTWEKYRMKLAILGAMVTWGLFQCKDNLSRYIESHYEIRWSWECFIFIMGIALLVRQNLYIESFAGAISCTCWFWEKMANIFQLTVTLLWLGYLWPWPLTLNFQGQIISWEWEAWLSWNEGDGSW